MKDDQMITLSIFESQTPPTYDQYEVFTCEKCDFSTCERIGRCSRCGGRLLDPSQENERQDGIQTGIGFIFYGLICLIIPAIVFFSKKISFADLFSKASGDAFWSVSLFTYLFGLPICFISTGIVTSFIKRDSTVVRLLVGGAAFAVLIALNLIIFPLPG